MTSLVELKKKLHSWDNKSVQEAVAALRVHGWLQDGALDGVPLCYAHLEGCDLMGASLRMVDLHQADLRWADLSLADLTGALMARVNLEGANLSQASLKNADLYKANLGSARNLTDAQLAQARRLYGAIMPNGSVYDGRYNLPGDLEFARWGRVDSHDQQAMANFLGVSLEVYLEGQQAWQELSAAEA